jgi:hypothetical protein
MNMQVILSVMLVLQLFVAMAAAPVIGVATARGSFRLDNAAVTGNGTVFEGSVIETGRASGELQLSSGTTMQLGLETRGQVYRDRLVLQKGISEIRNAGSFGVEASTLRIVAEDKGSVGRVEIMDVNKIQVAALRGNFRVTNASGIMIAALSAGRALEFETKGAGASAPSTLTGCLVKRDGHYLLTDDTTGVMVELKGASLDKYDGHKIEVTGGNVPSAVPVESASQVIQVSNVKDISKRCSVAAGVAAAGGAAAGAGAAAGGAAAGGAAAGGAATAAGAAIATKAVVAGVVVAAAATGTAIAVTTEEEPKKISK